MKNKVTLLSLFFLVYLTSYSQENELRFDDLDPTAPSKAAFYSAVIPGLGQGFNKKYWKIPIVYAAIGSSAYLYDFNNKKYWDYRNAYKSRKAGYKNDPYQNLILDDDRLLDGADFHKKNRDLSMVFIVGFYILNILDANIDAHLKQYNVNESLTIKPYINNDIEFYEQSIGISLNLNFKMKIALLGYGKMGKEIEKISIERGHTISLIKDKNDVIKSIDNSDVAINFSTPDSAIENIKLALNSSVPIICGTTGWLEDYDKILDFSKQTKTSFLYSSNYSLGVNLFFDLNKKLAKLISKHNDYTLKISETHHTEKLDKPSGTAITIAEDIINNSKYKNWSFKK